MEEGSRDSDGWGQEHVEREGKGRGSKRKEGVRERREPKREGSAHMLQTSKQ